MLLDSGCDGSDGTGRLALITKEVERFRSLDVLLGIGVGVEYYGAGGPGDPVTVNYE